MSDSRPDPVEEWAPRFTRVLTDSQVLDPAYMLGHFTSGVTYCKLCDAPTPSDETDIKHVKRHTRELAEWRKKRASAAAKDAAARLREVNAEKKLQKELIG